jgi:hypothetical protein
MRVIRLGDGVGNVGELLEGSHGRGQAPPLHKASVRENKPLP